MKTPILYLAFTFAVGLSGAAQAFSTTFAEWDDMNKDEQSTFMADKSVTIFSWLKENDPAKAKCMYEKFEIGKERDKPSDAFILLNRKIKGVPTEDRPNYHVENLMANYIIDDLCAAAVHPASTIQGKPTVK